MSDADEQRFNRRTFLAAAVAIAASRAMSFGQAAGTVGGRGADRRRRPAGDVQLPASLHDFTQLSLVLGRVTDRSATLNLLSRTERDVTIRWALANDGAVAASKTLRLAANLPAEFQFENLQPDKSYRYSIDDGDAKGGLQPLRAACRLQTQRAPGQEFVFTIQGDSHPERPQMFDASLYAKTLQHIAQIESDFHLCMGDDFSLNTLRDITQATVRSRYELQRPFLGIVGQSAPLFLLNGNHEQASLFNYSQPGQTHDAAVWAQRARNNLFSQPMPDGFYTGNATPLEGIGPMRNYFAWTWGDALFVVLDCYWHSPACVDTQLREDDAGKTRGGKDRDWWGITIGDAQYAWLKRTLETSQAKFKFVFAHHVLGTGRGGIERAPFFEWGGESSRGVDEFAKQRPDWALPIHQLMVKTGVSIFFQGHDHLYAKQELDGIIYQTVPVPADPNYAIYNGGRYLSGVKHPNSGYLRVKVTPTQTAVQYVRSYLADDEAKHEVHGAIAHEYTLMPRTSHD